ncbi:MAG: exo-alpha-sialidase [Oscillospiraceae bacterium]|jgi:predicted neuraminidase|nr:exo-alpha-sialidase [Oscillospiraceae bacterium]
MMQEQSPIAYNPKKQYEEACLPTPYGSNHASNLLGLPNGDLLCAYFAGSREGNPDISIVMSRLPKGERCWTQPVVLSGDPGRSEQNPVLFLDPSGKLWLFYTAQDRKQQSAEVRFRTSLDKGETWSGIATLFDKPGSFIRNRVVVREDGTWILPAYYSQKPKVENGPSYGNDFSVIKYSKDNGRTWGEIEVPESRGFVHMTIVRAKNGGYLAFFRSRWADFIYQSRSDDGLHWQPPKPTGLPNNNSSIQAINLSNGKIALVCNPVYCSRYVPDGVLDAAFTRWTRPEDRDSNTVYPQGFEQRDAVWQTPRTPLALFVSDDGGESWRQSREIESTPEGYDVATAPHEGVNYNYAYPSVWEGGDNMLHISYTYSRDCIKYVTVALP